MPTSAMASDTDSEQAANALARRHPASKGTINNARTVSASVTGITIVNESAEALHAAQQDNFVLRQQMKKLRLDANSRDVEDRKSRAPSKTPGDPDDPGHADALMKFDPDIAKHGRKYSVMISPWLSPGVFDGLKGRPHVDPLSEDRYDTKESMLAGTIAELYDFIPEFLHGLMQNHSRFASLFRHHLQSARSNAVSSVRQRAGFLYTLKQEYFDVSFNRASVPELQAMLKIPRTNQQPDQIVPYALLAPILFEGGRYDRTLKSLFKNPLLPNIAKVMLYGKVPDTKSKPQTLGEIWKISSATPGLIAFTAVLARFLVSPDEEFRSKGKITKIEWEQEFTLYKRMLSADSRRVRGIFEFFNENVFGRSTKDVQPGSTENETIEEFEDAMRVFGADDSFDDGSDADSNSGADARDINSSDDDTVSLVNDDHTILLGDDEAAYLTGEHQVTSESDGDSESGHDLPDKTMIINSDDDADGEMYIPFENSQDPSLLADDPNDRIGNYSESQVGQLDSDEEDIVKVSKATSAISSAVARKKGSLGGNGAFNPPKSSSTQKNQTATLTQGKKKALVVPAQITLESASESESSAPSGGVNVTVVQKSTNLKSGGAGKGKKKSKAATVIPVEEVSESVVDKVTKTPIRKSTRKAKVLSD